MVSSKNVLHKHETSSISNIDLTQKIGEEIDAENFNSKLSKSFSTCVIFSANDTLNEKKVKVLRFLYRFFQSTNAWSSNFQVLTSFRSCCLLRDLIIQSHGPCWVSNNLPLRRFYVCFSSSSRYQQFLNLVPTDPTVLMRLGNLYEEEGDKSQAFQYMYEVS